MLKVQNAFILFFLQSYIYINYVFLYVFSTHLILKSFYKEMSLEMQTA